MNGHIYIYIYMNSSTVQLYVPDLLLFCKSMLVCMANGGKETCEASMLLDSVSNFIYCHLGPVEISHFALQGWLM